MWKGTLRAAVLTAGLALGPAAPGAADAAVALNEVNCQGTDWVEVVNSGDQPVDLSGWLLTDDPLDSDRADHRLPIASGTTLAGGGNLVLAKGPAGFPFGISCGDDTVRLADTDGHLVDEVAVPELGVASDTWGRYPNATGAWMRTTATRGSANVPSNLDPGAAGDQAAWLYDPTKVVGIDLSIPGASKAALDAVPDEYQPAAFTLTTAGGSYGPLEVGVRLKGHGTFRTLSEKAAFKVKFGYSVAGQRFLGLKGLTLNNMVVDGSMVRETLAYEAFRAAGVPASRTGYAYVKVNGEDYGLYLNLENVDDVSLARLFGTTRHLYEGDHGVDVVPGRAGGFDVDEGDDSDRSDLDALITALGGTGDLGRRLAPVADLQEMVRMWAVERYIGDYDSYSGFAAPRGQPANYFLHSDAGGRFSLMPWGTDVSWVRRGEFDAPGGGVMFNRCLADTGCERMYRQAVAALPGQLAPLKLDERATDLTNAIAPWAQRDPRRERDSSQAARELAGIREFISARPGAVERWLRPPPAPRAPSRGAQPTVASPVPALRLAVGLRRRAPLRSTLRRGLAIRLRCSQPCGRGVRVMLRRSGRRPLTLAKAWSPSLRPGSRRLVARFSRRAHRLLRRRRSASMLVIAGAFDRHGSLRQTRRAVLLRR